MKALTGFLKAPTLRVSSFIIMFILILNIFSIVSFEPVHAIPDYNFGAVGDWGCNSNTDNTVDNIDGRNPERVFALGDLSYVDSSTGGTCWFNAIQPIDSITRIAIGNHEDEDGEGFSQYMSHFGLSKPYYSFDYQNSHILVMDSDHDDFDSGSAQYNFIISDLQSASQNPNIKWIIVYDHKQFYTSPNTCGAGSCSNTHDDPTDLRNTYHQKFEQYGVDLVLSGHIHNYQRTYPIKYDTGSPSSPTVTDSSSTNYVDPEGQIFAIVGTGGINFHGLSGKASWVKYQQASSFGALNILVTNNGEKLVGQFYSNSGSKLDEFSITKTSSPPPTCGNINVPITSVTASSDDGNVPANVLDNNLNTRWSASGNGQFITSDLGSTLNICEVDIAWYKGNERSYNFVISTSTNGNTFTTKFTGSSSGTTLNSEKYAFTATDARYVRVTVNGNNVNSWDSITEKDVVCESCSPPPPSCGTTNIPISGVTASSDDGNVPANVLDNNLNTRWSSSGNGQFITSDLGSTLNICEVDIAWYKGNERSYNFVIATSTDGNTFTTKFTGSSSGTTLNSEKYPIPSTNTRYVKVTVNGNNVNSWNSITEKDVLCASCSPPPPPTCTTNIPISGVTASSDDGNVPSNVLDNNLNTRWSASGNGQFITADLGSTKNLCSVDIAWYKGNERSYNFVIATSTDGNTFTNKLSSSSSGTTLNSEKYPIPSTNARYIKVTVNGNSVNGWDSMTEMDTFGDSSSITSFSLYDYGPSLSLSGPSN